VKVRVKVRVRVMRVRVRVSAHLQVAEAAARAHVCAAAEREHETLHQSVPHRTLLEQGSNRGAVAENEGEQRTTGPVFDHQPLAESNICSLVAPGR
jgi:hypothetical protein